MLTKCVTTYSQNCSLDETNLVLRFEVTLDTTVYTTAVSLVPLTILLILAPPPVAVATSTQLLTSFQELVQVLHGNTARNDMKR